MSSHNGQILNGCYGYVWTIAGIQGTNKAAKYHVILDENGFSADAFQVCLLDGPGVGN